MATEPINIPIQTSYDDQGAKDALRDAEKLDKLDPTVDVEVEADTSKAIDDIDDVTQSAKDLIDRNPWVAQVLADVSAAKSDLEGVQGELRTTGDVADDTARHIDKIGHSEGPRLAGNQVADLTGPFGDASSAASNFGGVFDGLADIGEKVAAKIGLDAALMASAISGIGFAVAGAAAVWSIFKQKQDEAKKKAAEHLKIQGDLLKAIQDGNREVAASKFIDLYGKIIDKGHEAGLTTDEVVDSIRGIGDAAPDAAAKIRDLDKKIGDLAKTRDDLVSKAGSQPFALQDAQHVADEVRKLESQRDALQDASTEFGKLTDEQRANEQLQGDVQDAIFGTTQSLDDTAAAAEKAKKKTDDLSAAMDELSGNLDITRAAEDFDAAMTQAMNNVALGVGNTREEIRGIQDDVIAAAEATGKTPIEVRTELQKIDAGDLAGVKVDVEAWYRQHAIEVTVKLASDSLAKIRASLNQLPGINLSPGVFGPAGTAASASRSSTTVNVNLPRGARHGDISRAMGLSTRRNGRRYGNPSGTVQYARR